MLHIGNPRPWLIISCLVLSACQTASGQSDKPASLDAYISCNLAAARRVAGQPGDPISLAVAARGICLRQERQLSEELIATKGELRAHRVLQVYREGMLEANTAEIVKMRARTPR
ncbi:MAG: hypothetical protein K2Z80_00555 [Xanthobacteraceae bacterium]|nr:hypothetical protein [Xanthobacteraceae bacterium]